MSGKFIVVEGLDRAGKSSQCAALATRLRNEGHDVVELKFPDRTTSIGKMINSYLADSTHELNDQAIHLLFSANRWELAPKIQALLAEGKVLIVDRYVHSGIAFSSAKGLDIDWCQAPDVGLPEPDLIVFLDISESAAAKRGGYGDERYEKKEFQAKVREKFLLLREPSWAWINADASMESVADMIYAACAAKLNN